MVNTWRAVVLGVTFASGKSMIDIFQDNAGTRVYRVRRAYIFNNQIIAVAGVITTLRCTRITNASGGSSITPVAHDTNNSALAANFTAGSGRTTTATNVFRQFMWSNDEPVAGANTLDEWELLVPLCEIWNAGYGDINVQPIACNATEGFQILHSGTTAVGIADLEIEFTDEVS